jgi:hypothetical protein
MARNTLGETLDASMTFNMLLSSSQLRAPAIVFANSLSIKNKATMHFFLLLKPLNNKFYKTKQF